MTIFLRLLAPDDKGAALADAVDALRAGQRPPTAFAANPASFAQVPGSPFAYWVGEKVIKLFTSLDPFESATRTVRSGLVTANDFRFVRAFWEVETEKIITGDATTSHSAFREQTLLSKLWVPFARGGNRSAYYSDLSSLLSWRYEGKELKAWAGSLYEGTHWSKNIKGLEYFFRPGLTWPLRASTFSPSVLPSGNIFSVRGYAIHDVPANLPGLLSLLNSQAFDFLYKILLGRFGFPEFVVGVLQQLPIPALTSDQQSILGRLSLACVNLKRDLDRANEISHVFHLPTLLQSPDATLAERAATWAGRIAATDAQLAANQRAIDDIAFDLYGIAGEDRRAIEESAERKVPGDEPASNEDDEREDAAADTRTLVAALASYLVGAPFGRWDMRYATGERAAPELPDPFAPLPVCPPGMLQNAEGLPATSDADIVASNPPLPGVGEGAGGEGPSYPLRIAWPGILVNDEGHPEDIAGRVREAIGVIWGAHADAIEQEACEILGVRALRDYLRKPASFFADHLGRYSKSRRQAPTYWPLATASSGYTLWLYYHRLSDQTLYSCVNDFVDPKLATVSEQAAGLRRKSGRTAKEERELEALSDTERELAEFRAELLRVAAFWKPNLNDGVQITAAPLWTLFAHKPWQKKLKETWASLEAGDYDWAHLAYSVWPERVREKCKGDKSLAIAHDLEALYVAPPATAGKKRGRAKQIADQEEAPLDEA